MYSPPPGLNLPHWAGVLSEEELGSKLYIAEVPAQEYAAHVNNLR